MNAIFSLHKEYSDLIFSGEKDMEFRNIKPKIENGDKIYIYETKKNGCGEVVGYFICGDIIEIPKNKVGTYNFILKYARKNCSQKDIEEIERAMAINLADYDNSIILDYIFDDEIISYIEEKKDIPDFNTRYNIYLKNCAKRIENERKRTNLFNNIDTWLRKIGYYNIYDEANWKYYIEIKEHKKFENPIDINNFKLLNDKQITRAPQSFCYTKTNI